MGRLRTRTTVLFAVLMALVSPAAAVGAEARADALVLVSIRVVTPQVDVSTGWGTATVVVHARHPDGLADVQIPMYGTHGGVVTATRQVEFPVAGYIGWQRLDRVSGTSVDGVWQGSIRLSPAWSGTYTVTDVHLLGLSQQTYYLPVTGPEIVVSGGEAWAVTPVTTPVKVVTGYEQWRPQARVTNTRTGRPVGGARVRLAWIEYDEPEAVWQGSAPGTPADAAGLWTSPVTYRPNDLVATQYHVYGGRGSRGWSLQGIGCTHITVQLQASARYADTTPSGGEPVVVTGNVWPAPAVLRTGAVVHLQRHLGPFGWRTVTTATVRDSGRYTLTWQPPQRGGHQLRVRLPGNGSPQCRTGTVGTTLAATTVTVR